MSSKLKLFVSIIVIILLIQTICDIVPNNNLYHYICFNKNSQLNILDVKYYDAHNANRVVIYFKIKKSYLSNYKSIVDMNYDVNSLGEEKFVNEILKYYNFNLANLKVDIVGKNSYSYRLFFKYNAEFYFNNIIIENQLDEEDYYRGLIYLNHIPKSIKLKY